VSRETSMNNREYLIEGAKKLNLKLSISQIDKFIEYLELIKYWNKKINITAICDDKEIIIKHFLDSLIPLYFENFKNKIIIDIGTGAGLPGIPIKIIYDREIELTLIDSSTKKISIVKKICDELYLTNIEFINKSVEEVGNNSSYRDKFDIALIRAVGNISTILEYSIPLLKYHGQAFLYKGPNVDKEVENSVKAQELLKAKIVKNLDFIVPLSDYKRNIIVVEKIGKTEEKYPRRVGIPRNRPL
jgi:16S rRNA (guanine527-N7)-methyltransferase